MKADLQRELRYALAKMKPEELKKLGYEIVKAADYGMYDPAKLMDMIDSISITIASQN